jgi:hypothetical protein
VFEVTFILLTDGNADLPNDPIEKMETTFLTPEGSLIKDRLVLGSIFNILAEDPGLHAIDKPLPGCVSRWLTGA